jgi:hypothetical protein
VKIIRFCHPFIVDVDIPLDRGFRDPESVFFTTNWDTGPVHRASWMHIHRDHQVPPARSGWRRRLVLKVATPEIARRTSSPQRRRAAGW